MTLHPDRVLYPVLTLCLAVVLAACGGSSTHVPAEQNRPPTGPAAGAPVAPVSSLTATSDAQKAPTATPTPTPTHVGPSTTPTPAADLSTATPTLTPTSGPQPVAPTSAPAASRCEGLEGQLEIQVLAGPAEAVGLEPVAVGSVPIGVTDAGPPSLVEGQAHIAYEDVLQQQWGTYAVTMDLDVAVQGTCGGDAGREQLALTLEMAGEQLVVVDAGRFRGEYPWSGTRSLDLVFPLGEGATAQGEGWSVVLHLDSP